MKTNNKCPKCGSPNYIVSVFGSICQFCYYDSSKDTNSQNGIHHSMECIQTEKCEHELVIEKGLYQECKLPKDHTGFHSPQPEECKYCHRNHGDLACRDYINHVAQPEEYILQSDPIGEVIFNGVPYVPKDEIRKAEERKYKEVREVIEKEIAEYMDWDAVRDGRNQPHEGEIKALKDLLEALKK